MGGARRWGDAAAATAGRILGRYPPAEAGTKLEMRGYIGLPIFGRSQTWIREP